MLASAVAEVDGALYGGTALAIHLRHRQSFDLDYLVAGPFDPAIVAERLTAGTECRALGQDADAGHPPQDRPDTAGRTIRQTRSDPDAASPR